MSSVGTAGSWFLTRSGQDRTDEPDDGGAVGEDADHVGAAGGTSRGAAVGEDLLVCRSCGLFNQICR